MSRMSNREAIENLESLLADRIINYNREIYLLREQITHLAQDMRRLEADYVLTVSRIDVIEMALKTNGLL